MRIWRSANIPLLTVSLIIVSVIVTLLSGFGEQRVLLSAWFISNFPANANLPEISKGEYWRLLSPIFLHFHILHLLFNMLWLWDLGRTIERYQSVWHLLLLVLVIGVFSNLAQFYFDGPRFGGMSGVVYGLLSYVWLLGTLHSKAGVFLHKHIAIMMLVWYFICWTGVFGPIANMAHTAGLVIGLVLGLLSVMLEKILP